MAVQQHILLLVGSPRRKHSNSLSLGAYLLDRLSERGCEVSTVFITKALKKNGRIQEMLEAVDRADILIFSSPLYVDSLPALVVQALEVIAEHRSKSEHLKKQRMAAILNCGFPESNQNNTACAIFSRFAYETGYEWAGCLKLGGGEFIGRKPLEKCGRILRNARKALDIAAVALAAGNPVPDEAARLMAKQLIPTWLYLIIGTHWFKRTAKKNEVADKLLDKPYKEPPPRRHPPKHV